MKIRNLLISMLFLTCIFCLSACENKKSGDENMVKSFNATGDYVKKLGRTFFDEENNILWCGYSGSGVEFTFKGTSCEIEIQADSTYSGAKENLARIAVYVNDERVLDDMIDENIKKYTVVQSDIAYDNTVKIVKLSESAMSTFGIKSVTVNSENDIKPTADKDLFIEFIGDSITCGYGVDDEVAEHHFSTATEDFTKAYAYLTAQELNADYSMVSISGYGIISGYTDNPERKNSSQTLPKYYEKVAFAGGNYEELVLTSEKWDFNTRQPDVIVINLGTNDDSYCQNDSDKQNEYMENYVLFLEKVRKNNPDAKIVCTLGIMGDRLFPQIEKAVSQYCEKSGDKNISSMKFDPQNQSQDGIAADWHPSHKTHQKAASKLSQYLTEITAKPIIALSFDDGPNTGTTVQVLDVLERYGIVASFFVIGNKITEETEPVMKRAVEMGCEIENHSKTHPFMDKLDAEAIADEIKFTSDKIEEVTGRSPQFFRPPYIAVNETMFENIDLPFIAGFGANDWEPAVTAEQRAEKVIKQARDGAIILLHDMEGNVNTVEALDTIIPALQEQGYEFVNVSQVFSRKNVIPTTDTRIVYNFAEQK